jgi:hypothetical protein
VIKKYGKAVVTVTGHSLGGTKAIYVSSLFSIPAYVYDAGWSGQEATKPSKTGVFDKTSYVWHLDKVMSFNAWGDPVSLLQGKAVPHKTIYTSASDELKQALWHAVGEGLTVSGVKDFVFKWAKSFMTSLVPGPGGGYQTVPTSDPEAARALDQSGITAAETKAEEEVAAGGPEDIIMTALVAELAYLADMALRTHGIKEFRGFHTAVVS